MPVKKISSEQAEMIRTFAGARVSPEVLAAEYNCTVSNINLIVSGRTHKGYSRPRSDRGLSASTVSAIKSMISSGLSDYAIWKQTGVSRGAVYQIRIGKSYKEI